MVGILKISIMVIENNIYKKGVIKMTTKKELIERVENLEILVFILMYKDRPIRLKNGRVINPPVKQIETPKQLSFLFGGNNA
tara:strand:- start:829 stop:1074 length:246 start_codon:yes stop_codon:yes gene_type:complete